MSLTFSPVPSPPPQPREDRRGMKGQPADLSLLFARQMAGMVQPKRPTSLEGRFYVVFRAAAERRIDRHHVE